MNNGVKAVIGVMALLLLLTVILNRVGQDRAEKTAENVIVDGKAAAHEPLGSLYYPVRIEDLPGKAGAPHSEASATTLPEGVSDVFHDKPETQVRWMERGQQVVLENYPDADHAVFRNTFFYRGFTGRPVTCGEVLFERENEAINDYQRFVYVGIKSSYLERNVVNFDIFWDKMCVQTHQD